MGNAETLPLSQAKQDIGYVAIVLRRTNKVRIIYDTPQTKSVLYEIVSSLVRYVSLKLMTLLPNFLVIFLGIFLIGSI
jgi:hypothetical protein